MEINNSKITRFYPYEAVHLTDCFLETSSNEEYQSLTEEINYKLNEEHGIFQISHENKGKTINYCKLSWDNKVTFQIITRQKTILYYQFYDGKVRIGTGLSKRNFNPLTDYIEINKPKNKYY